MVEAGGMRRRGGIVNAPVFDNRKNGTTGLDNAKARGTQRRINADYPHTVTGAGRRRLGMFR